MDVTLPALPTHITDAAKATVSYLHQISKGARFAQELITWLVEERRERHRERVNIGKNSITYKVDDMVMARVQVQSSSATGVVGKLAIEARGPF